jgi:aspartyl-tRNA synthetase
MAIKEHYFEVLDVLDNLFLTMFDGLSERFAHELSVVNKQFPFEPLKYLNPTLRLEFPEVGQRLLVLFDSPTASLAFNRSFFVSSATL